MVLWWFWRSKLRHVCWVIHSTWKNICNNNSKEHCLLGVSHHCKCFELLTLLLWKSEQLPFAKSQKRSLGNQNWITSNKFTQRETTADPQRRHRLLSHLCLPPLFFLGWCFDVSPPPHTEECASAAAIQEWGGTAVHGQAHQCFCIPSRR